MQAGGEGSKPCDEVMKNDDDDEDLGRFIELRIVCKTVLNILIYFQC